MKDCGNILRSTTSCGTVWHRSKTSGDSLFALTLIFVTPSVRGSSTDLADTKGGIPALKYTYHSMFGGFIMLKVEIFLYKNGLSQFSLTHCSCCFGGFIWHRLFSFLRMNCSIQAHFSAQALCWFGLNLIVYFTSWLTNWHTHVKI